jgi:hypothetical protein
MAALCNLVTDERQATLDDLQECRRLRLKYLAAQKNCPGDAKLQWQVDAADRWIDRYERELAA